MTKKPVMGNDYNYIVVGAGLTGITITERIAHDLNQEVLLIEERPHIGGNCHDYTNKDGILQSQYGPHIIHTNDGYIKHYLSHYSKLRNYKLQTRAMVDGELIPLPPNLNTIHSLIKDQEKAIHTEEQLIYKYGYNNTVTILELKHDPDLQDIAELLYEKIYHNYTVKQWDHTPTELSHKVTDRIPVRINYNNNYFTDTYQFTPTYGYTHLFRNMLNHDNIHLQTGKRADVQIHNNNIYYEGEQYNGLLIWTGMIDQLFQYKYGRLPYRSLQFKDKTYKTPHHQDYAVQNYPNTHKYTRRYEHKQLTGQQHPYTTVTKEYPQTYNGYSDNVPCYPIPTQENTDLYMKYKSDANKINNLLLCGRLATYQYLNMDQAISEALLTYKGMIQ